MKSASEKVFDWQWPEVGPTPVSYGLDAEIFDSEKFPNAQTFVREAIQNSLDARLDQDKPVRVRFNFYSSKISAHQALLLGDLRSKKSISGLPWPQEWDEENISWLTVQDFNSFGLQGDLDSRTSDFWNYWLNFGLSNKNGTGRGGRGIGRVTFLIASRISTVLGITNRAADNAVHTCGMSVLRPVEIEGELRTSYAYLAKSPHKNIFDLYSGPEFNAELASAFSITEHLQEGCFGLGLVIPYPHPDLTADKLIAASIEHFAPAIVAGQLVVEINSTVVDSQTIGEQAARVATSFGSPAVKQDARKFLALVALGRSTPNLRVSVDRGLFRLTDYVTDDDRNALRTAIDAGETAIVEINVPVTRNGNKTSSKIVAVASRLNGSRKPLDFFFREGMALPEVVARVPADIDLVVLAGYGELATYLNFCEGKAHLDLLENRDVREKLKEHGFADGVSLKRSVRRLMDDVRALVLPDSSKPDASVMGSFFAITRKSPAKQKPGSGGLHGESVNPPDPTPPAPPPPPKITPFLVSDLPDGFSVAAHPAYMDYPASFTLKVAYATGEKSPKWSPFDFDLQALTTVTTGAVESFQVQGNTLEATGCGGDFVVEVRGFDVRRELAIKLDVTPHAEVEDDA